MANTTGGDKLQSQPWTMEPQLKIPAAIPATSTIFYAGQAIMRDANGNAIQCDDTQPGEFIGILQEFLRPQVDPTDIVQANGLLGDKMFTVKRPHLFTSLIAAAAAGDEGRKVYWQFNNQVQYTPGNNGNYAGTVYWVKDATHVQIMPPWVERILGGSGRRSTLSLPTSGLLTMTKFAVNRTWLGAPIAAVTITLPPVAKCSPGDQIAFKKTNTAANQITLAGSGTDLIEGGTTSILLGTTQWSRLTIETDGTQWFQVA